MAGFRPAAGDKYRQAKDNRLVLFDGAHLAWILESRFDYSEALRVNVQAESIQGNPYAPRTQSLTSEQRWAPRGAKCSALWVRASSRGSL